MEEMNRSYQASASGYIWAVVFLACAIVWAIITLTGHLTIFDEAGVAFFRVQGDLSDPVGPFWFETAVIWLTHLGDSITLIFLSVVCLGWLLVRAEKGRALYFTIMVGGAFLMTPVLKQIFDRARPDIVEHLVHATSPSFPSGHTLRSAVAIVAILLVLRNYNAWIRSNYVTAICVLVIGLIGVSRVYLGVHWPSDVVFSWLISASWYFLWRDKFVRSGTK